MNHPYTEKQWQKIDAIGHTVEQTLQKLGIGLTMGGEPTFVSLHDFESPQWQVEALGEEKRQIAGKLLRSLDKRFTHPGTLLHYGLGKCYARESYPRWAFGCYWRRDGIPIWRDRDLLAVDRKDYNYTQTDGEIFIQKLVKYLAVNADRIIPAYEEKTEEVVGYILPILPITRNSKLCWSTCQWELPTKNLYLLPGNGSIGLRLPLHLIPQIDNLETEANPDWDARINHHNITPQESVANSIRIAMSVEVRQGNLYIFLPPLTYATSYLNLISTIEETAAKLGTSVVIEGYPPPSSPQIQGFQITPDPGVIEVNIHPANDWQELVQINDILDAAARECGLSTQKYARDGRPIGTGGGAHITIGGKTTQESPLLRRPDLLASLITYWQHHPSLSYLFSGLFVGPTSQSPRVDEARHESLYELEIAFSELQPGKKITPELIDSLLSNLLIDVTGNTHRTAFCIDKLFPVKNQRNQLGLLEFRAFEMPTHPQMRSLQMLLIRALVAWFWENPYHKPLIRWGTTLHDRFMLPYYLGEDLQLVIEDLQEVGYPFAKEWFAPFFEFRFPVYGEVTIEGLRLELRHAIEPWHVLAEEATSGGTARYVDASMERIQVTLQNAIGNTPNQDSFSSRYAVTCNYHPIPLKSTGKIGEYVGGVRFRAHSKSLSPHPATSSHSPLSFEIIDTYCDRSLGGGIYYVDPPDGTFYDNFPTDYQTAELRMKERFLPSKPIPGKIQIPPLNLNPEYPLTLDLRRVKNLL
ncbi:MAG TPA: transglutaminase family protein [Leptolyngbyaceae cyanobacterium]